jgi:hypothetical protein
LCPWSKLSKSDGHDQQVRWGKIGENVMSKFCAYLIFNLLSLLFCIAALSSTLRQQYYLISTRLASQPCVHEQAPFLSDFIGNV